MSVLLDRPSENASPHVPRRLLPFGGTSLDWAAFTERYGSLPTIAGREVALLSTVEASGLSGRGGAGFPTARKLNAVRSRRAAVVVANGTEGEPASSKDEVLLRANPHLVIDGALAASSLVGAEETIIAVSRSGAAASAVARALAERPDAEHVRLEAAPEHFVTGEETALVHWLNGGDAKPTFAPPRPFERGVGGRPTLVQNVETLANLALVCRYGAEWYRETGTAEEPGSALVTVSGAVAHPNVVEAAFGTPLHELVRRCGGATDRVQAVLIGGYFGTWVPPRLQTPLSDAALGRYGARLGARALVVLGERTCGLVETARVASYLAQQSAGQCGPCVFGLPAVAQSLETVVRGGPDAARVLDRLPGLYAQIAGRGACAHPDGVVGLVASALRVFEHEVAHHLEGRCTARNHAHMLPTPVRHEEWR